ncbi:hypothetical protein PT2222_160069 [Paraburkholderia tropica]
MRRFTQRATSCAPRERGGRSTLRQRLERELDAFGHARAGRHVLDGRDAFLFGIAEREQRVEDVAGVIGRRRRSGHRAQVGAELALEFEQQTFGRFLADAGHAREARGVLHGDRLREVVDAHAREHRERHARADAADLEQFAKRGAFFDRAEAVEQMRVFAHDHLREQHDFFAIAGQVVERAHRHVDFVADAVAVDEQVRRVLFQQYAGNATDHGGFSDEGKRRV